MLTDDLVAVRFGWEGTGTGDVVAGSAQTGFRLPPAALIGEQVTYEVTNSAALGEREIGRAVWDGTTLLRSAAEVIYPAGGAVDFTAGTKFVSLTMAPKDIPVVSDVSGLVTVENVAALQAITPTAEAVVWVEGHTTPGDGGGGLFRADMTGALETDGGIVFGATADESAVQTESGKEAFRFINGFALAQQNLVWGTVEVDPESASAPLVFPDIALHGHRLNCGGFGLYPLVNHKAGTFPADAQQRIDNYVNAYGAGTVTSTVRYRYLTNPRRWVRQTDGYALDVRWFGVAEGAADQRDKIAWALNAAKRLGFKEVRLNGEYTYLGGLELPEGVAFGWGKLTVGPGVLDYLRNDYVAGSTVREALAGLETCISPEDNSADWRLYNLELDGHYGAAENVAPLENNAGYALGLGVQSTLQNTPAWNGFSCSNHSGRVVPNPQYGVMEEVHIHGYGGNCWLGHGHTSVTGRNVRLGDSVRNHVFYGLHGVMTNLTVHGFSWAAWGKSEHCHFYGLNFEHLRDFDFTADGWNAAAQLLTFEGMRRGPGTLLTGAEADRWRQIGISIEGGQWDLDGFTAAHMAGPLLYGGGQHLSVRNVTVMGPISGPTGAVTFFSEITLGGDSELYEGWSFKNITIMQRGIAFIWSNKDPHAGTLTIEDCSIQDMRGYEGVAGAANPLLLAIVDAPRTGPNATIPRRIVLSRFRSARAITALAKINVASDAAGAVPIDFVIEDCTLPFGFKQVFTTENGTGSIAGMTFPALIEKLRMSFIRTAIGFGPTGSLANLELLFAASEFRDVQTIDLYSCDRGASVPLLSEVERVYVATATDASNGYIDAKPGLLWAPKEAQCSGPRSWTVLQVRNSANSAALTTATSEDKRNPVLRFTVPGIVAGERYVVRASLGPRGTAHLIDAVAPTGGGGGISAVGEAVVAIAASGALTDAANGAYVDGTTLRQRKNTVLNSTPANAVALTFGATVTQTIALYVMDTQTGAVTVQPTGSAVWEDGTTTARNLVVGTGNTASAFLVPIGNNQFRLIGDVVAPREVPDNLLLTSSSGEVIGTGTRFSNYRINERTTAVNTTIGVGDRGGRIVCTAAVTVTVPAVGTLGNGAWVEVQADGGAVTIDGPGATNVAVADGELAVVTEANSKLRVVKAATTVVS